MIISGLLGGGTPVIKRIQVQEDFATAGVPATDVAANDPGIALVSTGTFADVVGVTLDTATFSTTQGTGANSAERLVSVIINPDAIVKGRLSGGATAGTALAQQTVTVANAGGITIETGTAWNSPEFDEGVAWGFSGSNVAQKRKITATSGTTATINVPFDNAIAVGDIFLRSAHWTWTDAMVLQLTTNLDEVDASIAVGTGGAVKVIDTDLLDISSEGTLKSFVYWLWDDPKLGQAT